MPATRFDGYGGDDETTYTMHYLPSSAPDPRIWLQMRVVTEQHVRLSSGLAALDERSRDILQQRWLSDDKSTLHELARNTAFPPSAFGGKRMP